MITVDGKEYSEDDLNPEQRANVAAILRIRERIVGQEARSGGIRRKASGAVGGSAVVAVRGRAAPVRRLHSAALNVALQIRQRPNVFDSHC